MKTAKELLLLLATALIFTALLWLAKSYFPFFAIIFLGAVGTWHSLDFIRDRLRALFTRFFN